MQDDRSDLCKVTPVILHGVVSPDMGRKMGFQGLKIRGLSDLIEKGFQFKTFLAMKFTTQML